MSTATTEVRERPILFSAQMVQAILAGKKTQTRRVIKPQPDWGPYSAVKRIVAEKMGIIGWWKSGGVRAADLLPYKETYSTEDEHCIYRADLQDWSHIPGLKWKSGRFMPRAASRITLEITAIRVQRLQDISEEDALAEGVSTNATDYDMRIDGAKVIAGFVSPTYGFSVIWHAINGKTFPWQSNPWVWAITFKLLSPAPTLPDRKAVAK